jgi:hypothetical protein
MTDLRCPPSAIAKTDGSEQSIMALASRLNAATNSYRAAMDERLPFRDTMSAAGRMARAADALTNAIADAVAEGEGSLT